MKLLDSYNITLKQDEIIKSADRLEPNCLIVNHDRVILEYIKKKILNKHSDESSKWGLGFVAHIGKDCEFIYNFRKKNYLGQREVLPEPFNPESLLIFELKQLMGKERERTNFLLN